MELKLRNRRVISIGNSKGFIIPTEYQEQNLQGGISDNERYDLTITRSENQDETED